MHRSILFLLGILCLANAFQSSLLRTRHATILAARTKREAAPVEEDKPRYIVGENLPEEIIKMGSIYDMVLVERLTAPEKTQSGLFMPVVEGKDKRQMGKVLSIPISYGLESEQGRLQEVKEICPFEVGDLVFLRDAWGIGPKDIEVGERKFSFHKALHVTGIMKKK